jgi:hypothetical protein
MRRRLGHEGAGERSREEARRGAAGGGAKASGHGEAGVEARRGRRRGEAGSARRSRGGQPRCACGQPRRQVGRLDCGIMLIRREKEGTLVPFSSSHPS